jgi:hypothetical protein
MLWDTKDLLRAPIWIYDDRGKRVWWGFVDQLNIREGTRTFGIDMDTMFNRVKATYELLPDGTGETLGERADTVWTQDDLSVREYGAREKIYTLTAATIAAANDDVANKLEKVKYPQAIAELAAGKGESGVELICSGWWKTTGWQYYENVNTTYQSVATQLMAMAGEQTFFVTIKNLAAAATLLQEYRNGDALLQDEIQELMTVGSTANLRVLATVDQFRNLKFYEEPQNFFSINHSLTYDNRLYDRYGNLIPPQDCTVGVWANLKEWEHVSVGSERVSPPSPIFIERAIYDIETGVYQPEARGQQDVFLIQLPKC